MSSIDERIVKMIFDNSQFDNKVTSTISSLTKLNQATDDVAKNSGGLSALGKAFEQTEITATRAGFHIQDVWLKMANVLEYQIARKVVDLGKKIANALTLEGITDGFKEYELKMGSIQTIMAGTGESLATVNRQLEELNKYSDQTIYSFADMTNNIGKFTNAGVKLEDAVAAIKGIANEAAISGANANEASRAMYNFSQALSAGYVKLIDWKSIENANMATKGFKETLLEVASSCGTVEKGADGMYKVLTQNANGGTMDELVSGTKNFNDSLAYQWMTTEVLTKALKIYATDVRSLSAAEKEAYETELRNMGLNDEQIKQFEELGIKATDAASEIKTFTMLIDTLKEAVGSGWAMTWQYIVGDFEQAKALWTEVGKVLGGAIDQMSEARNNLIKGGLQTGWEKFTTMTGAAIPESEKFRDVLLDVGRAHGALTEEQIKDIDSTEDLVNSFHDLGWVTGSMLEESVESYLGSLERLTDEQKKEMGVTDADISELRNLNEMLKSGAWSADEFAESMINLGGRENVIMGLRYAFEGVVNLIKPITQAFREVFPALTSDQLYNATDKFRQSMVNFFEWFSPTVESAGKRIDNLKRAAKGFFSIIDIGIKFVKAFVNALAPAGKQVGNLADKLLEAAANIGDFFTKLDQSITENKTFETFFSNIREALTGITEKIHLDTFIQKIKDLFQAFKDAAGPMGDFKGVFNDIVEDIKGGIDNLKERIGGLKPLVEGIGSIFKGVASMLGGIFKGIGESLSGISSGGNGPGVFTNLINGLLTGGMLYKLMDGFKSFSSIGEVIEQFGDTLGAFQKRIQADSLMSIAKAIAVLAGSLFVIAMIDSDKLAGATVAIGGLVTVLTGAMAGLMAAIKSFSSTEVTRTFSFLGKDLFGTSATKMIEMAATLKIVSDAMLKMAESVLLLSVALAIIAKVAEGGHLWDSFLVLTLLLGELTGVALLLGKFSKDAKKGSTNLMNMAAAIVVLSAALAIIAKVVSTDVSAAWQALAIISIMLGELLGITLLIENFTSVNMGGMAGLLALAGSVVILVYALKQISDALGQEGQHIWQALGVLSVILVALTAVTILLSNFGGAALLGGMGAIAAAAALLIVVQSLKQVNDMLKSQDQHVWQSLGVIAAALAILAVGLLAMSVSLPGAAALVVASAALIILAGALKALGSLRMDEIGHAMLAMGASLLILAVGLTAMIAALPGAAALVVAAAGLTILAGALKILGSMSLGEIVKSLLSLVAALAVLGVASAVLGVISPLMLAFGAALTLVGVGLLAAGVGITILSSGLQALVAVLPMGVTALKALAVALIDVGLALLEGLLDAIGMILQRIPEFAPAFGDAVLAILTVVLRVLAESSVQIAETVLTLITALLQVLTEHIPELAEKGAEYLIAFMNAFSEQIPKLVDAAYKCAIELINGLAQAIEDNNVALIEAVDRLMTAIIQAITQWLVNFTPLGLLIPQKMKDGIMSGEISVKDEIVRFVKDLINRIKERATEFKNAATHVLTAFKEGVNAKVEEIKSAFSNMIDQMVGAIKSKYEDFKAAAENLLQGFVEGFKSSWAGQAIEEAKRFASDVVSGMNSKKGFDEHSPSKKTEQSGIYLIQGLMIGMEKAAPDAIKAAEDFGSSVSNALALATEIAEDSLDLNPVITPVLDISELQKNAGIANSLLANKSMSLASQISLGFSNGAQNGTTVTDGNESVVSAGPTFIQNNYSPKALSRMEIYRQTRNQISMVKGVVKGNA